MNKYFLCLSALLLCSSIADDYATATATVSRAASGLEVSKPSTPGIICVYPNLSHTYLYVEASCSLDCELLDVEGNVLLDCGLKVGITLLDTSSYAPGTYVLRAGTETFTIII